MRQQGVGSLVARAPWWLHFLMRVVVALMRRISLLFQFAYVFFLGVPVLLTIRRITLPCKMLSGHGSVLILCERRVAKVASSMRSTIGVEFDNVQRIKLIGGEVSASMPSLSLHRSAILTYLLSDRYYKVALPDVLDCAVEVRRKLSSAGLKRRGASLDRYPQLQNGLEQILQLFGEEVANRMTLVVKRYLADGEYHTGLCHGDFHSRNIMRDQRGEARVIDLDCVRFEGIVELDCLYFSLEWEWSATGALWLDTLALAFDTRGCNLEQRLGRFSLRWHEALGLVYFLDRVGQENINYGFKYPNVKLQFLVAAFQRADNLKINEESA